MKTRTSTLLGCLTPGFMPTGVWLVWFGVFLVLINLPCRADESVDPAYLKVVTERAAKIADTLGIDDSAVSNRVTTIIANQYVDLSRIHDARDAAVAAARETGGDKAAVQAATDAAHNAADAQVYRLHAAFLARLAVELDPRQVVGVKDGLTYGVVNGTYAVYMKMYPGLSEAQKRQVMAWLIEARELAMDQGSSDAKHRVFGKYKGRINNYLVKEGYDLKKGEENLKKSM